MNTLPPWPNRPVSRPAAVVVILLTLLVILATAPAASMLRAEGSAEAQAILRIEPEIDCPGCEDRIKHILETTKGVLRVDIDVMNSRLVVKFIPSQCTVGRLLGRVEATGYHARLVK